MLQSTTPQTNLSASPYHAMHSLTYNTFSLIYETIVILELQFYCKFLKNRLVILQKFIKDFQQQDSHDQLWHRV